MPTSENVCIAFCDKIIQSLCWYADFSCKYVSENVEMAVMPDKSIMYFVWCSLRMSRQVPRSVHMDIAFMN